MLFAELPKGGARARAFKYWDTFDGIPMITVANLNKHYVTKKAISDINFTIAEGEIVGLLGLNGAGKSTILKILGCYLVPSSGSASVCGYSTADQADDVRSVIGYLPDTPPLYNEMTIKDYLVFVSKLKNVPAKEIESKIETVMAKTAITDVQHFRLGELSHGYRQRVSISQALVHDPKILILDEPINGLDPIQIVEMRDLILSLKKHHTVILSSHILSEVTKTCDRILVIDKGRLVAEGSEQELRGMVAGQMTIALEWQGDSLKPALEKVAKVKSVAENPVEGGFSAEIDVAEDVRSDLAAAVIGAGGRLLSLAKKDVGLESVFLQIINNSGDSAGKEDRA